MVSGEIDLHKIIYIIKKKLFYMILIALIFGAMGYVYAKKAITPMYTAKTTLLINSRIINDSLTKDDIDVGKDAVKTCAEIVKSKTVLNMTAKELNIDVKDINGLTVTPVEETQILVIAVNSPKPELASIIANTIAKNFIKEAKRVAKLDSVEIVDKAVPEKQTITMGFTVISLAAAVLGGIVALGFFLILGFTDKRIRIESDLNSITEVPILCCIKNFKRNTKKEERGFNKSIFEQCRTVGLSVMTNMVSKNHKRVIITSPAYFAERDIILTNLVYSISTMGFKVLILDLNLREPTLHKIYNLSNDVGLTDYIIKPKDVFSDYGHSINDKLDIVTTGMDEINPIKLYTCEELMNFINKLEKNYDLVLLNVPPMLVSDTVLVSKLADDVIYLLKSNVTSKNIVKKDIASLSSTGLEILGCVLCTIDIKKYLNNEYYEQKSKKEEKQKYREVS